MVQKYAAFVFPLLYWAVATTQGTAAGTSAGTGIRFHQEVWRTEEGLPQNTVPAIVQSRDGYLWAGTELGLVRFDGLHFTVFDKNNTPELKSNVVDALVQDRRGNLWIGTVGGGLTRLKDGKFSTFTIRNGLSNDFISCLLEDPSGDIWIGTNGGGLTRLHDGHFRSYATEQGLADNQVFALAYGSDGALWVGTHDGLNRFSNGRFQTYRTSAGLPNNYVRCLFMTSSQTLWIGTYGGGLARFENGMFTTFTMRDGLTSNSVVSLGEEPDGTLWIGTLAGGLNRLSSGRFSSYTSANGLPSNDIWCIYYDKEQNLWIGTGGGGLVRLFSHSAFTSYDKTSGLSDEVTLPVFEDHEGSIWIGTNGGGLNRFRNGTFRSITLKDGLADDLVFTIGEGPDGALWIGTRKGLNRLKDGKLTTYTVKDGLPNNTVIVVYADREGAIWIGTRAGLSRLKDRQFTTFTTKNGLSNNIVQALYEDRKHRLWIGTAGGGLDVLENGRFQVFDTHHGLSNDVVLTIHEDARGVLWIGTDGGGLVRLKGGQFSTITTRDGLLDDAIFRVLQDNSGNLWMSSNKGIFRASLQALNDFAERRITRIPVMSYGVSDGMRTKECNGGFQPAGWKSRDGRLWFPTMKGVVVIDPRTLARNATQQLAFIEQVIADEHELPVQPGLEVPPGGGELEFHFSAPNLRAADRIHFQYRLKGFDTAWVHAGQRRAAYYTNIPPGRYRFEVVATNEDGTWSTITASLPLLLKPHFYQTLFFYALCAFAAAGAALAIHLTRIKSLRERERILEQHVQQRTVELRNEIAERERAELESVKAKETAEEANRVKGEFLANMSHEIRTPMNGILGMTQLALGGELNQENRQYLELVQDSAGALLRVIDDILDFSKVEAGKLELDRIDFVVRDSLEAALKPLSLQAQLKEIRLELSIDPDAPSVIKADPLRLRQIILNLVGNAMKFTDEGAVNVKVGCDSVTQSEALLHFVVSDTGIGIPSDKLASIFEAFSQADSSTTRKFGGTGLGLAICNKLVQLMGGTIWARSEVNRGSEFHFTMKAGIGVPGMVEKSSELSPAHGTSLAALARLGEPALHILLAEDNPANRMVARLTLEKFGIRVHETSNGMEALGAAQQFRFDAILMDCRMPVMDGYEATRQIRRLTGQAGKTPIIALTASAFKEDRVRAKDAGMDDFIAKPFQEDELIQKCFLWTKSSELENRHEAANEAVKVFASASFEDGLKKYSAQFLQSVMEIFLETAPPVFESLVTSIRNGDWDGAKDSAHWLRGGASRVIAPDLQEQLDRIENACAGDSPGISKAEVEAVSRSFRGACQFAETWLSEHKTECTTS